MTLQFCHFTKKNSNLPGFYRKGSMNFFEGCTNESKTHLILIPFFMNILRLKSNLNVKLWSIHLNLCFARF